MHQKRIGIQPIALLALLAGLPLAALALDRPADGFYSQPRVEFSFNDEASVTLVGQDFSSSMKWDYADVESLLKEAGATDWQRLFAEHTPAHLDDLRKTGEARRGIHLANLNNWFTAVMPSDAAAKALASGLAANRHIRSADPTPIPHLYAVDLAPTTPNYMGSQNYQAAAPAGTGIASAWAVAGGNGQGMNVLHCEGGWVLDHEDYDLTYTGGGNSTDPNWWNHGTACVSILGSPNNGYGVTGMTPNLDGLFSHGITANGGASAWIAAMASLNVGDVISASWGYSGAPVPGEVCVCNCGQFGGVPAEANQADFDAIQTVTANGYIVVNSASNGSMPLDDPYYNGKYDLNVRDSGALLIGAIDPGGVPTCWTNHGSRVDAHAWGSSVVAAGYGSLFNPGGDTRQWYTATFGGTSAACPIVSGCVAAAQGIYKSANGGAVLDAWQFRTLLRSTGTDQTGDFAKNISNQPDMVQLIAALAGLAPDVTPPSIVHTPLGNSIDQVGPYSVSATISDASGVAESTVHYRINGGAWSTSPLVDQGGNLWTGSIPGQIAGSVVDYYLWARDGAALPNEATSTTWFFTVLTEAEGIVLLTPSTSALSSGAEWTAALVAAGYPGTIMNVDNLDGVALGPNTDALIVLLGIYSNNFVVPAGDPMATAITDFANAGGSVYLEGGDVWAYDPGNAGGYDFGPLFGINGDSDGGADLVSATGHGPISGTWAYSGENNWIDQLSSAGASLLFSNNDIGYECGFYQNGPLTTAGLSFELAGLSGFQQIVATLFGEALLDVIPGVLSYAPASLEGTAMEGGSDTDLLTLTNTGGRTVDYLVRISAPLPLASVPQTVHLPLALAKGAFDPRPGSVITAIGGPDSFGYAWIDSDQPGGPALSFQDISGTGTALSMSDDDSQGPFPLGFPFHYYANLFHEVRVCSNGFVTFGSTSTDFSNDPIPTAGEPEGFLAPFWDDLNPLDGGTVHYQAFADRFIVQWTAVPHYQAIGTYTFQVILHDDGIIEYQYGDLAGDANSATVGIENILSNNGLQVVYNAPYLHSNMAVRMATWMSVDEMTGSLAPGASTDLVVGMNAASLPMGVYHSTIHLTSNAPSDDLIPAEFVVTSGPRQPAQITGVQLIPTETDGSDNVLHFTLQFPDVTVDVLGNPIVVDRYDFWWSFEPYGVFPIDWSSAGSSTASELVNFAAYIGIQPDLYFVITAVDEDGVVLASSQPGLTRDWDGQASAGTAALLPGHVLEPAAAGSLR